MVKPGKAVLAKPFDVQTVIVKPKDHQKKVYRLEFPNLEEAELCIKMHESVGDMACLLEKQNQKQYK